jgi:hypothetical protein
MASEKNYANDNKNRRCRYHCFAASQFGIRGDVAVFH